MAGNNANSDKTEKWYFTKEQLESTPSRKHGHDAYKELSYRQQAASFIQSMGQKLKVSQLCINTAIVYMHRFYVFHSFTHFPWYQMAAAALFLAAKVEEQPRKLEYVIRVANACRNNKDVSIDVNSERYIAQSQELVFNENLLLQTLGFELAIDHPHTHVVRCCHLVRASKDLAQTSYFMASNSLHLTTMCLQYKPTVVACFCIHVACKWSNWEIPLSNEEREWFSYVDPTVTSELLQVLTKEFLTIFESCSSRLKEKIMAIEDNQYTHNPVAYINSPFDTDPKKVIPDKDHKDHLHRTLPDVKLIDGEGHKHRAARQHDSSTGQQQREREYREKKERERLAMQQQQHPAKSLPPGSQPSMKPAPPHGHHRSSADPKLKMSSHSRPLSAPLFPPANRLEPRDILRDSSKDSPFGIASKEPRIEAKDYGGARGDKDASKSRGGEHPSKLTVNEVNSANSYGADARLGAGAGAGTGTASYGSDRSRADPGRLARHLDPTGGGKARRHEDVGKAYPKSDADNLKAHLAGADYLAKPAATSTSQRMKSPFNTDSTKSVLKSNVSSHQQHHGHGSVKATHLQQSSSSSNSNGTTSGSFSSSSTSGTSSGTLSQLMDSSQIKQELFDIKQEPFAREKLPVLDERYFKEEVRVKEEKHVGREHKSNHHATGYVKKPSLFSPEKSPPQNINSQTSQVNASMKTLHIKSEMSTGPSSLSPLLSPSNSSGSSSNSKSRRYSNSEPELRPVMQKIDQVEGFENLKRDPSIGVKLQNSFSESRSRSPKYQANSKVPEAPCSDAPAPATVMNGIETNPTLISNLLKESPAITINMPPVGANTVVATHHQQPEAAGGHQSREKDRDHHHHKSKKKNKEKHKHKDKDKSKEDKEKKKKHKDKDREKHRHKERHDGPAMAPPVAEPIKIKIQKDKIQPMADPLPEVQTTGLKIKIPKDKIKTEMIGEPSYVVPPPVVPSGGLKIKISKDVISGCSLSSSSSDVASGTGKKRDRGDRWSPNNGPPAKIAKTFHREQKANGRHSHSKVAEMGEGELFLQRLAESKYTKGSS